MPIYVYKCPECLEKHEKDHGMAVTPTFTCEKCDVLLRKIPGVGAVSFKGGGWGKDAR